MVVIKMKSTTFEKPLFPGGVCVCTRVCRFSGYEEQGKERKRQIVRRKKLRFWAVGGYIDRSTVSQTLWIKTG